MQNGFHGWISSYNDGSKVRVIGTGGDVSFTTVHHPSPIALGAAAVAGYSLQPSVITSSVRAPPNSRAYWQADYYKGFRVCN